MELIDNKSKRWINILKLLVSKNKVVEPSRDIEWKYRLSSCDSKRFRTNEIVPNREWRAVNPHKA